MTVFGDYLLDVGSTSYEPNISTVMPSLESLLIIFLLQFSEIKSTLHGSHLHARDVFDTSADITEVSLDPDFNLGDSTEYDPNSSISFAGAADIGSGSDIEPLTDLSTTSPKSNDFLAASNLELVNYGDSCVSPSRKRKRNNASCVAPNLLPLNDEQPSIQPEANPLSTSVKVYPGCEDRLIGFGRIFDVCCNGPLGPFAIDNRVRLVYNWIGDCHLGLPNIFFVIRKSYD